MIARTKYGFVAKVTTRRPGAKHGFVALLRNFEISYAHFEPHIGIGWTRNITFGPYRVWLTEGWRIYASKTPRRFRIHGR